MFGDAVIEILDRLAMLFFDLPGCRLCGVDLLFQVRFLTVVIGDLGLERRTLVFELPGLQGCAAQRLAQAIGLGVGAGLAAEENGGEKPAKAR